MAEPTDDEVELFFRSGGASLLSNEALQRYAGKAIRETNRCLAFRLWDKVCTGDAAAVLLKTVLLELVTTTYWQSRSAKTVRFSRKAQLGRSLVLEYTAVLFKI